MKTQLINFTIPKELLEKIDRLAKKESRSRADLLREAVRRLTKEEQEHQQQFLAISASGRQINLPQDEAIALIDKVRATLPINK